ncbi:MAG: (d)CMP kinase [Holosporaceae bacterium]|jgi:cytidylate kinase|nr:(d)CMP kinase [Holosporaceae bacterium]
MGKIWKLGLVASDRIWKNRKIIIAVDGPSSSGKGTIAKLLANQLGYAYLDTGLLYRIAAYRKIHGGNTEVLDGLLVDDFMTSLDIKEAEIELRSDVIGQAASEMAKSARVREILTKMQRKFARNPGADHSGVVLDGRDIGTVVIPDADVKLFITADLETRTRRRFQTLKQTNPGISFEQIHRSLAERDKQDRSREIAPLTIADDYVIIDTSKDSIEESLRKAIDIILDKQLG